jgi:hypothetical protein
MPTTTSYGNWVNIEKHSVSVEDTVASALGDYVDDYDLEALVRDYREAINEALPSGVALCGNEFIGPAYEADCDFGGYELCEDGSLDLKAIVDGVDGENSENFWEMAARHDKNV